MFIKKQNYVYNKLSLLLLLLFAFSQIVLFTHHHQKHFKEYKKQTLTEKCSVCQILNNNHSITTECVSLNIFYTINTLETKYFTSFFVVIPKLYRGRSPPLV